MDQFSFFSLGITRIPEPADKDFFFLFLKQDRGEAVRWEEVEDIPPVRKSCPATSQSGAWRERGLRTGPRTVLWWCGGKRVTGLSQVRPPPLIHLSGTQPECRLRAPHTALGASLQMLSQMTLIREHICFEPVQPPATGG